MSVQDADSEMYQSLDELLEGADDCPDVDELFDELEEEDEKKLVNEDQLRQQEDWSFLAHQVVGAESVADQS